MGSNAVFMASHAPMAAVDIASHLLSNTDFSFSTISLIAVNAEEHASLTAFNVESKSASVPSNSTAM